MLSEGSLPERGLQLSMQTANILRDAILAGEVAPGERLSVPAIARRLGVSRTPAREALIILEREGLLSTAGYGMTVIDGDHDDVLVLLEIREALEGMSARLAATRVTAAQRSALADILVSHERALDEGDVDAHVKADADFHALIAAAAGNRRLAEALGRIEAQIIVLNNRMSHDKDWSPAAVWHDHGKIAAACADGDGDGAEQAMRAHVRRLHAFYQSVRESGQ